jgi:transcriptional regulator with XRE-family HTH domain
MPYRVQGGKRQRRRTFIRQWREARGLTQEQLAAELGTSVATVSRVETGNQPYTQDFLEACANALGTDVVALLSRDPNWANLL